MNPINLKFRKSVSFTKMIYNLNLLKLVKSYVQFIDGYFFLLLSIQRMSVFEPQLITAFKCIKI